MDHVIENEITAKRHRHIYIYVGGISAYSALPE